MRQLTLDGREVPVEAPDRLFAAPPAPAGSLALPTDPEVNPA